MTPYELEGSLLPADLMTSPPPCGPGAIAVTRDAAFSELSPEKQLVKFKINAQCVITVSTSAYISLP